MDEMTVTKWCLSGSADATFTSTTGVVIYDIQKDDPPDIAVPVPVPIPAPTLPGAMALTLP